MADADAPTTTRPSRARKATAKAAAPKAAKTAPKAAAAAPETTEDGKTRLVVHFEYVADTKSYAKWQPPKSSGCVGAVYVPIGTETVRMLLLGPADE